MSQPPSAATPPHADSSAVERLAFLARAGEVLASSLHMPEILQEMARLAVPLLGDLCIIDLLEADGLRRVATAHTLPRKAALLDELRRRYPPTPDSPQPAQRVIVTGKHELLQRVDAAVIAEHTRDREHARLISDIDIRSHLAVPLVHRGSVLGVLNIGITESARTYTDDDVALAQELARRAALAIDHARLYELAQTELAERRRAEASLRLSEARFRAIFEQSPLSTQILARDGTTRSVNRAWEQLWGFTVDQLGTYNILSDEQLEKEGTAPLLRRAFAGEAVFLPTICYDPNQTIPNGSRYAEATRWVSAFAYPITDADGDLQEVVLVHQDVTDVRRHQDQLRDSEARLRLALNAGRMNVWDWDLATGTVACSENAREFWGLEIGHSSDFLRVIHPDDLAVVEAAARTAMASGEQYFAEYRLAAPPDRPRWVQSRGRVERDADGTATRMIGVTLDVTELKRAEASTRLLADVGATLGASLDYQTTLRQLSRLLVPRFADWCSVDLLGAAGELEQVAVHHADPRRVELATELVRTYPPKRDAPYGRWRVIDGRQPVWAEHVGDEVLQAQAHDAEHLRLLRGLGLRSYICVPLVARDTAIGTLTIAYAESGRQYTASDVELAADLGRRAAAAVDNAQLHQQLRAEHQRKDEFLATLAHELRNPLAPIRTGLGILRATVDDPLGERTTHVMERQLAHMVHLVDDLLDLSRVTRGAIVLKREHVDLSAVAAAAIETSRSVLDGGGVQLVVHLPEGPLVVDADGTRLAQVLSNLLNNAAKFTPAGGRVELSAAREGSEAVVVVKDTGLGIPRGMLNHIFDMFAQVHQDHGTGRTGLGIGLTLVRRLVELHGGRVWAESAGPGHGSTFTVRLPLATPLAAAVAAVPDSGPATTALPRRVLVVDDNHDAADMLAALLSHFGHDIRVAESGEAALHLLEAFCPEIAFLDIGLPGMSGYELAQRIRAGDRCPHARLVAVTGWGQADDRRRSIDAGFDEHMTKPVEPEAIVALVSTLSVAEL